MIKTDQEPFKYILEQWLYRKHSIHGCLKFMAIDLSLSTRRERRMWLLIVYLGEERLRMEAY